MAATFNNSGNINAGRDINQVAGSMIVRTHFPDARPQQPSAAATGAGSMTGARVFITYRHDDASGEAGRLYDSLTQRLGRHSVFMDAEELEPGQEFGRVIRQRIGDSDVVLVLIGRRWAGATDAAGRWRLDDPDDWVRREIETALDLDVTLVPVLVQGAPMPTREDLPPSIRRLADLHALTIGAHWQGDVDRLAAAIRRHA